MRIVAIIVLIAFWSSAVLNPICFANSKQGKIKIVLLKFDSIGFSPNIVDTISDRFRQEINKIKNYHMLSHDHVKKILDEKAHDKMGPITDIEEIKYVGKLLGVDQVLVGILGKVDNNFIISIKLINVQNNETKQASARLTGTLVEFLNVTIKEIAEKITNYIPLTSEPFTSSTSTNNEQWYKNWYLWTFGSGVIVAVTVLSILITEETN